MGIRGKSPPSELGEGTNEAGREEGQRRGVEESGDVEESEVAKETRKSSVRGHLRVQKLSARWDAATHVAEGTHISARRRNSHVRERNLVCAVNES